ncbi:hypothetical protein [Methylobacterium planeticum]|uniref:Uncharacterized protein n=1 Tax=Methylobacterium planeticum TaxID=2615211 RepID=A0A6N6MK48_9HYPH|nr:hypothetical protein [Methylobacterium planeticum]KAB1071522.1 hypothetical protein F6X51_19635 [Methylobacterium planeticum]
MSSQRRVECALWPAGYVLLRSPKRRSFLAAYRSSLAFVLVLPLAASLAYLTRPSGEFWWCDKNDRSGVVCVRNWLNAVGNLGALIIAGGAAAAAYGQYTAAKQQPELAQLPSIEAVIREVRPVQR